MRTLLTVMAIGALLVTPALARSVDFTLVKSVDPPPITLPAHPSDDHACYMIKRMPSGSEKVKIVTQDGSTIPEIPKGVVVNLQVDQTHELEYVGARHEWKIGCNPAQDKRDHPVTSITIGPPSPIPSGGGIEKAIALCDQHIDPNSTLVECPGTKLCNGHYTWPECYAINDAYRPTAKKLQEQEAAEKATQDEADRAFVQSIAKTLKCTPATCAGTLPPPHSGDVGPFSPGSSIAGTTSFIVDDGIKRANPFFADDLKRAFGYCRQYLQPRICDGGSCWAFPNESGHRLYTDNNCYEIEHLWLFSDWKKQDDARDNKAKQDEIERAKAFVAAVMRQKP